MKANRKANMKWHVSCKAVGIFLAASVPFAAHAQTLTRTAGYYTCKVNGRTINADVPPPECANLEIREYGREGFLKRVIEPPLTPEQRAQREEETKRKQQEELARANQKRRDTLLLQTYASTEALEQARQRALNSTLENIKAGKQRLQLADEELQATQSSVASQSKISPVMERKLKDLGVAKEQEEKLLQQREQELLRINVRFDADKARWLELNK